MNLAKPLVKMPQIMDKIRKFVPEREPKELSFHDVIDRATTRVCRRCKSCTKCWVENYGSMHSALFSLQNSLTEFGAIADADFPQHFSEKCHRVGAIKNRINQIYAKDAMCEKSLRHRLSAMPPPLSRGGEHHSTPQPKSHVYYLYDFMPEIEAKLLREFEDKGISVSSIVVVQNANRHLEISLNIRANHPVEEIVSICQAVCGHKMRVQEFNETEQNRLRLRIVQRASFDIEIGVSKEAAKGEATCGDAYSFTKVSDNKTVITISDGCGHGWIAAKYSEVTVDLVKRFLAAGVPKNKALELVNSVLLLGKNVDKFATADIAIFDSFSGMLEIVKLGANSSYIVRASERKLDRVSSSSLPVGIFTETDIDNYETRLMSGDYVIMLSDGIENPGAPWLGDFLDDPTYRHAGVQVLADRIMREAKGRRDTEDDRLVVVAKVVNI
ncbi:MAG: SpoIIE family protein phosphatase [Oscillospiraceae bacterium]|nr:SpoIIE family protein phosphatase [Oscillospiraceae bacterium]